MCEFSLQCEPLVGVCLRREEIAREEIRLRPIKESFGGILGIINGKRLQLAGNFFYIKKKKRSAPYNNLPTHITSLGGILCWPSLLPRDGDLTDPRYILFFIPVNTFFSSLYTSIHQHLIYLYSLRLQQMHRNSKSGSLSQPIHQEILDYWMLLPKPTMLFGQVPILFEWHLKGQRGKLE